MQMIVHKGKSPGPAALSLLLSGWRRRGEAFLWKSQPGRSPLEWARAAVYLSGDGHVNSHFRNTGLRATPTTAQGELEVVGLQGWAPHPAPCTLHLTSCTLHAAPIAPACLWSCRGSSGCPESRLALVSGRAPAPLCVVKLGGFSFSSSSGRNRKLCRAGSSQLLERLGLRSHCCPKGFPGVGPQLVTIGTCRAPGFCGLTG